MGIQIEVPLEALRERDVHEALVVLMSHLAGHTNPHVAKPNGGAGQAPPRARRRRRNRRATSRPDLRSLPASERWARYVETLPETSRTFLRLLEDRGRLTVDEAVDLLGFDTPKAMGGLTGAMARWAPKQGVELPFTASKDDDGQRCWLWTRSPPDAS